MQALKPPTKFKGKSIFFVKTQGVTVMMDNIKEVVSSPFLGLLLRQSFCSLYEPLPVRELACFLPYKRSAILPVTHTCLTLSMAGALQVGFGEIGAAPLQTLHAMAQGVFIPLLTSPQNQRGWPDVVAREVSENLHKFVANGE